MKENIYNSEIICHGEIQTKTYMMYNQTTLDGVNNILKSIDFNKFEGFL